MDGLRSHGQVSSEYYACTESACIAWGPNRTEVQKAIGHAVVTGRNSVVKYYPKDHNGFIRIIHNLPPLDKVLPSNVLTVESYVLNGRNGRVVHPIGDPILRDVAALGSEDVTSHIKQLFIPDSMLNFRAIT